MKSWKSISTLEVENLFFDKISLAFLLCQNALYKDDLDQNITAADHILKYPSEEHLFVKQLYFGQHRKYIG